MNAQCNINGNVAAGHADDATSVRHRLLENGYLPIPVVGKAPKLPGWSTDHGTIGQSDMGCLTRQSSPIGGKAKSRGLCNRNGPALEMETAAPVGAGNGGRFEKASSDSRTGAYSTGTSAAMGGVA